MNLVFDIEGGDFSKAGYASSQVKKVLKKLGVEPSIIKKIVVSTYEAEVNIVAHAYRGKMYSDIDESRILSRFVDEGPGIPDIDKAMTEGYSTASDKVREMGFGAGMGLPNIKKNADHLNITSEVSKGTILEITNYLSA